MSYLKRCESCGDRILSGDLHYINGKEVCEYCLDREKEIQRDEGTECESW